MLDSFNLTQVQGNQADLVENALNLMRRMPIRDSGKNLDFLLNALPEHERELLASIDRPLEVLICNKTSQRFIAAEYNRHGNSYRSPWSGEYYPEAPGGYKPPDHIRELETYLNGAFKLYVKLYYDDGVSSVYAWELDTGFAVAILIKRELSISQGLWDSIHVVEVSTSGDNATYKLTSTVMVALSSTTANPDNTDMDITGSIMKQVEATHPIGKKITSHAPNIGRLVEKVENLLRGTVCSVYFDKLQYVMNDMRIQDIDNISEAQVNICRELNSRLYAAEKS